MVWAAALVLLAPTAQDVPLDVIRGVRIGDTEAVAVKALETTSGQVTRTDTGNGAVDLKAAETDVTLCRGRVVHVGLEFGKTVHVFAQIAGEWTKIHGTPKPEIFAIDGSRSDKDPRGPAKLSVTSVRLQWAKAPLYMLSYYEINDEGHAIEALNAKNTCAEK